MKPADRSDRESPDGSVGFAEEPWEEEVAALLSGLPEVQVPAGFSFVPRHDEAALTVPAASPLGPGRRLLLAAAAVVALAGAGFLVAQLMDSTDTSLDLAQIGQQLREQMDTHNDTLLAYGVLEAEGLVFEDEEHVIPHLRRTLYVRGGGGGLGETADDLVDDPVGDVVSVYVRDPDVAVGATALDRLVDSGAEALDWTARSDAWVKDDAIVVLSHESDLAVIVGLRPAELEQLRSGTSAPLNSELAPEMQAAALVASFGYEPVDG